MENLNVTVDLPVICTRGMLVFPGHELSLDVGRTFSLNAMDLAVSQHDSNIVLVSQIHPLEEEINGISNIKNVGFQKGEALEKLIREARFSIYPSEWYENCPFSVMESQMYGTPVLGANIGGIPELILVGKTGELFESGNGEDLKNKIEELWNHKEKLDKYSENCKDINFDTIEEYCNKLIKIYE